MVWYGGDDDCGGYREAFKISGGGGGNDHDEAISPRSPLDDHVWSSSRRRGIILIIII